jgi:hypothetical protein
MLLLLELRDRLVNGLGSRRMCRSRRTRSTHDGPAIRHEKGSGPGQHVEDVASFDVLSCVIGNNPGLADARCARDYEVLRRQFSRCQLTGILFVHDPNTSELLREFRPPGVRGHFDRGHVRESVSGSD